MNAVTASPATGSPQGWPEGHRDQPGQRPGRGQRVEPGVPGVGDQRGRVDAPADDELVPGDDLVADNADRGPGDARAHVRGVAVLEELADALIPGERRAGPDDHRDPDPGQVLGPFQAVGIALGGGRRDSRKPRNTTALVETSDRLWIASPSSPTDPVSIASSSSMRPVAARPRALTATARLACRRSWASSRVPGRGNAAADRGGPMSYASARMTGYARARQTGRYGPAGCRSTETVTIAAGGAEWCARPGCGNDRHDQGGDPVGPPPSGRVVQDQGYQREQAGTAQSAPAEYRSKHKFTNVKTGRRE